MKYKSFWDIGNGITLCKECHSSYLTSRIKCPGTQKVA